MVSAMRWSKTVLAAALLSAVCAAAEAPELAQVHNVYILPMANGVDQYLANHLTRRNVFRVVTDPKLADAIFTENMGPGFSDKMDELYPPPEKEKEKEKAPPPEAKKEDKSGPGDASAPPPFGELKNADQPRDIFRPKISPWTRGKGNLFLVSRQSRAVIWSVFDRPKDARPKSLDHMAESVVRKLAGDLKQAQ